MKLENILEKKNKFLDENIFYGLKNLNDGFDAEGIKYFSETDFEEVLKRIKKLGLGIKGIELWENGGFYNVSVYEDFTHDSTDSNWYIKVFESYKEEKENLQYAATYYIPERLLQ